MISSHVAKLNKPNMKYLFALAFAMLLVCQSGAPSFANSVPERPETIQSKKSFRKIPMGIMINFDTFFLSITTANKSSFRIGVRENASQQNAINSIFLDTANQNAVKFKVIDKASCLGIETEYGKLLVNIDGRTWSLWDSNENLIINDASIIVSDTLQRFSFINQDESYGSGNYSTKNLIKTRSVSKMGNGTADIPYLWNKKGFSLLGITTNDDNPANWEKDFHREITWSFKGSNADMYVWIAPNIYDANKGLMQLTGKAAIPPKWAFGYLQSKWGWENRSYIEDVLSTFRKKNIPVDAFIYDFEWYTDLPDYGVKQDGAPNYPDFSFNPKLFPNPVKQIENYKNQGVKFIGIRKPRIGDSLTLANLRKKDWIVPSDYNNRDLDFRNKELREWYIEKNKPLLKAGIDAWWNDEGEVYYSCYYWWNTAQRQMLADVQPHHRFFSLNRSFSPGNQRLGYCTWNGDIRSEWKNLEETPADLLNWSLSGMFYGSCDIGGFGEQSPTKEIVGRWFQTATFLPIMRGHSNILTTPRFPWLWDEKIIKDAINLRYRLLPFVYSLAHEAYNSGKPIIRPLMMEFPADKNVENLTDQWLMGDGLMVAPIMTEEDERFVYFPKGTWFDFFSDKRIDGDQKIHMNVSKSEIPVFVKAGTIIPFGPIIQYVEQQSAEPLELRVYPGKNTKFILIEDDGETDAYTQGKVRRTIFEWNEKQKKLSWTVEDSYNARDVFTAIKVVVFGKTPQTTLLTKKGYLQF